MKFQDYTLMETCLDNALDVIMDAYENCDTSAVEKDYQKNVEQWNKELDEVINKLQSLKEEMIFTFHIED